MESGMRRGGEGEDEWYDLPPVPLYCTPRFPAFLGAKDQDSAQTRGPMTPFFILIHIYSWQLQTQRLHLPIRVLVKKNTGII